MLFRSIIGFFKRQIDKIKKSKIVTKITAVVVAIAVGLGLYSCTSRKTAIGQMLNSNLGNHTRTLDDMNLDEENINEASLTESLEEENAAEVQYSGGIVYENNSYYDNYSFDQLQEVTNNQVQRQSMRNVYDTLLDFNGRFADAHVEEGTDIRAALSFEEVVALQQAYNDYSTEDIRAIFNGADINASRMSRAYRDASLQLMGAYVIEDSENPVDMSMLIESEEGREFYQRYHQMFLEAKEATGEEKLQKIREFYNAVRQDFPITNEVRTEGIAHADAYSSVFEGKGGAGPAVAPMIAAAEIMWQNYDIDYTLDDTQIDFLNDIGLCNLVDEKFEKIEVISLGLCQEDTMNPTYHQYRAAIISSLKDMKIYVIDDAHRELSKLKAFQDAVNWHFKETGEWVYSGGFYETTETHTETITWTEEEIVTHEEETRVEKPIPDDEKEKIDEEIEEENERAREEAEEEAEHTREEMQKEEDEHAKEIEEEIKEDEQDLQDRIVFTGFVPYDKIPGYLKLADIAVLPSMWDEPFGLTIVEALAAGLPLITTRSGGIPEICEGVATIVSRVGVVRHLTDAILDLYEHPDKRNHMASISVERAMNFDKEKYAKKLFELIYLPPRKR